MAPTHMHMHFVSQNVYMSGCGPSMYATSALFPFTPLTATVTVKPANSTSTVNPLLPSPRRPGCALGGGDARGREAQTPRTEPSAWRRFPRAAAGLGYPEGRLAAPASGAGVQARAARPALTWPQSLNPQR